MSSINIDPGLERELAGLTEETGMINEAGSIVGYFVPNVRLLEFMGLDVNASMTMDELEEAFLGPDARPPEDVFARLQAEQDQRAPERGPQGPPIEIGPDLERELVGLMEETELIGGSENIVGYFVPPDRMVEMIEAWANSQMSSEELERAFQGPGSASTEEVLARLKALP